MTDYYATLEIERDADGQTIKTAYRRLALAYHPDRNPGDHAAEEKFKALNEAYAVLSDSEKRSRYDRFGTVEEGVHMGGDIFDIFASVFGANFAGGDPRRAAQQGQPGEDLERALEITLEQARDGSVVEVEVERLRACHHCHGDRAEPGSNGKSTCPRCAGAGQVRVQAQSIFGAVVTARACPDCHGNGVIISEPCKICSGRGREVATERIEVTLPRGIDGGYRLRVPREGNAGLDGAPAGDLYLYLEMAPHPLLERVGDDLHYELEVGMVQAALGASFTVPTLDGEESFELPPGTQSGREFRLRGLGMPRLRQGGSGDEVITVAVVVPKTLSAAAREHLEAYAEEVGEEFTAHESVRERVKGFFHGRRKGKEKARGESSQSAEADTGASTEASAEVTAGTEDDTAADKAADKVAAAGTR